MITCKIIVTVDYEENYGYDGRRPVHNVYEFKTNEDIHRMVKVYHKENNPIEKDTRDLFQEGTKINGKSLLIGIFIKKFLKD